MKCNTCDTVFTPIPMMEETEQASGCSASLYMKDKDYFILAHYGSRYDMQLYAMKTGLPYSVGNICDDCITTYINNLKAALIQDGIWQCIHGNITKKF